MSLLTETLGKQSNTSAQPIDMQGLAQLRTCEQNTLSINERRYWTELYGSQSSAYFNFQEGVEHFGCPETGFISYFKQRFLGSEYNIAFTRPVCADQNIATLVRLLREETGRPNILMAVDGATASALQEEGYRINDIGVEYSLDIQRFDVVGKEKKHLRWASNLGRRGFEVKEQSWTEVDADQVYAISEAWRNTKVIKNRELRLITRPPEFKDAWGVRKFFCYYQGKLVGFVFFDPYFEKGEVKGYTANILRSSPEIKPNGFLDFTILEAMKVFREEGIERLSLGLSPLDQLSAHPNEIRWLRRLQQWMYDHGNFLYAFKALSYHKNRYRPDAEHWYQCISPEVSVTNATFGVLRAIRVI